MVSEFLPWSILSYVVTFIMGGLVGARVATSFYKTFRSGRSRRRGRYGRRWDDGYEEDEEEDRGSAALDRLIGVMVMVLLGWVVYNHFDQSTTYTAPNNLVDSNKGKTLYNLIEKKDSFKTTVEKKPPN